MSKNVWCMHINIRSGCFHCLGLS